MCGLDAVVEVAGELVRQIDFIVNQGFNMHAGEVGTPPDAPENARRCPNSKNILCEPLRPLRLSGESIRKKLSPQRRRGRRGFAEMI